MPALRPLQLLKGCLRSEHLILYLSLLYFICLAPFTPGFATGSNLSNLLSSMMPLLIVACGQTLVLIAAGIDLSATSTIALASVIGAYIMNLETGLLAGHTLAMPAGLLIMLLVGLLIGSFNGLCITYFRMPPFIVTLTGMMFFSGLAIWITQSKSIYGLPSSFLILGKSTWISVSIAATVALLLHLLLQRTLLGRWIYATGQNPNAATISGVPVKKVLLSVYLISGVTAGLAAILLTGKLETGSPVLWRNNLLDIIGATVIGGTSLYGGKGKIRWTLYGVLFFTLVGNSLDLLGRSHFTIMIVKGLVILFAAALDTLRQPSNAGVFNLFHSIFSSILHSKKDKGTSESKQELESNRNQHVMEFSGIEKSFFNVKVLSNIHFCIRSGTVLGCIGENGAGKSTLMNIMGGYLQADTGVMHVKGKPYRPRSPRDASAMGIAFIHQELNLFPNLSVEDNLYLTAFPIKFGMIDRQPMRKKVKAALREVGLDIEPERKVETLSAGERQLVEIAKALVTEVNIIIFDEPTTSLTQVEADHLFKLIRKLRDQGVSMVYISHALHDVLRLCDDILVLRDGEVVGNGPSAEFNADRMIALMAGRELKQLYPSRNKKPSKKIVMSVRELTQPGFVKDINFDLFEGEVLGISGLMGSGRTELARMLFGLDSFKYGTVSVHGQIVKRFSPIHCKGLGMAFVTEDRRNEGLFMEASIADNISIATLKRYTQRISCWIRGRPLMEAVQMIRDRVHLTKSASHDQQVKTLSGGNQQKVVIAKWLLNEPNLLILDEPTRGIDVGARSEIYNLVNQMAEKDAAILMISSEIEELIGVCDRILVMRQGEIQDEIHCDDFDRERILRSSLFEGRIIDEPTHTSDHQPTKKEIS